MINSATQTVLNELQSQRLKNILLTISQSMITEDTILDCYEGKEDIQLYLPDAVSSTSMSKWVSRNSTGLNKFKQSVDKLISPIKTAELQYSGEDAFTDEETELLEELTRHKDLMLLPLVLKGKVGMLPWIDNEGEIRLSLLSGYIFPIFDEYQVTKLVKLLCFQRLLTSSGFTYTVWEISYGMVRVYLNVHNPLTYNSNPYNEYPQPHAMDRMPCAFGYITLSANQQATGYGLSALPAHYNYKQRLIQENSAFEITGLPQRVVTGINPADDPEGLTKTFSPYSVMYLPTGGSVAYPNAISNLDALSLAKEKAAHNVALAFHVPDVSNGAGESASARLISLEEQKLEAGVIANVIVEILEDTTDLLTRMNCLSVELEFSLTPEFTADQDAKRKDIIELFKCGIISRHESLMKLQEMGIDISEDEMLLAASENVRPDLLAGAIA